MGEKFSYNMYVPWVDTDAAGVVHFTNFLRYVERAEEELFRREGLSYRDLNQKNIWLPRVEAFIRYINPLRNGDLVEVVLWVSEIREKAVRYEFKIYNKTTERISAEGHLVIVCAEINGRSVRCPEKLVEVLKKYLAPDQSQNK
ncbi:MAG: thioesterase family protein [Sulfolobales archaeon]